MELKVTVDAISENYATLLIRPEEDFEIVWPEGKLPEGTREGDILSFEIKKDEEETEDAKERVQGLIDKLEENNN
ncbi:MAG: DUF3006 domain-containing protein [Bacteroidales bacterium]